ncbi:XRE family transcriptional regulator [Gulosibacter macacae]|uniref:XRE family transcriptional regulator n=1 Tax=Gulosibacter macacae TaxID=2488791 RepID=A0A3P3VUL8_9MICO|nr:XRE family transcriptional regulator [Gulosibacter macacae]RRJ86505.1 XRE family transcriptional regulator [Gulosibacter macacae]
MARFDPAQAPELIRRARLDAGLTQAELARRADLRQPSLAQMESGARNVSAEMLERVLRAADYRPSLPLAAHAAEIVAAAARRGLSNIRVFGSTAQGTDGFESDIDLLVTPGHTTDLFDLALFSDDVQRLTGFRTDIVSDGGDEVFLAAIAREAVPL